MRTSLLSEFEGQVVVLDLISGQTMTARIQRVDHDNNTVVLNKPRMFVPVPNPNNPNNLQVICLPYGHPMYRASETMEIDTAHVFTVFTPGEEQKSVYARETSGIIQAGAGALDQLKNVDLSKIGSNN